MLRIHFANIRTSVCLAIGASILAASQAFGDVDYQINIAPVTPVVAVADSYVGPGHSGISGGGRAQTPFAQAVHRIGSSGCRNCGTASGCSSSNCAAASFQFLHDLHVLPHDWLTDVRHVFAWQRVVGLVAVGGISLVIHEEWDGDVADWTAEHPNRWGQGQEFFAAIGNPGHQLAAIACLYGYSFWYEDADAHELSITLFNAVSITGLTTVLLKAASGSGTRGPGGEKDAFGGAWPSGHASSSFAFAAVLDEWYGPRVGIPAYILAGLVGWERIDDREHDLSDVVFGAALGYVVGKTVGRRHVHRYCCGGFSPYLDTANGTTGIAYEVRF